MDDSGSSPAVIRRATRTYGRRPAAEPEPAESADDSPAPATTAQYSWQRQLAAIDDEFDMLSPKKPAPPTQPNTPIALDDLFGGSLSSLKTTSPIATTSTKNRNIILSDNELEPSPQKPAAHSVPTSPAEPLSSPLKHHSSPTPPTSEHNEPDEIEMGTSAANLFKPVARSTKPKSKSKSHRDVKPLQFVSVPVASDNDESERHVPSGSKKPSTKGKLKAPTKRELKETAQERARLLAESNAGVSIPRETQSGKYTIQALMSNFLSKDTLKPLGPSKSFASSPISEFPSSPADKNGSFSFGRVGPTLLPPPAVASTSTAAAEKYTLPDVLLSDDDDEPQDLGQILQKEREQAARAKAKLELAEKKAKLMTRAITYASSDDDSDDLLVLDAKSSPGKDALHQVADAEAKERKSAKARPPRPSVGRGIQRKFGLPSVQHVDKNKNTPRRSSGGNPHFSTLGQERLTQSALNKALITRVVSRNEDISKKKQDEWVERGGRVLASTTEESGGVVDSLKRYAERGLMAAPQGNQPEEHSDDDQEDGDWEPEQRNLGSGSEFGGDEQDENENGSGSEQDENDATMVVDSVHSETSATEEITDKENENVFSTKHRSRHRKRNVRAVMVVDSDEDVENPVVVVTSQPPVSTRKFGSVLSQDESVLPIEIAIPVITEHERASNPHRGSVDSDVVLDEALNEKENDIPPFDENDNPFIGGLGLNTSLSQGTLVSGSPNLSDDDDDDDDDFQPTQHDVQIGFEDLFNAPTAEQALVRPMTLTPDDATGLQPALQVSGTFRRKADEIFEKEQGFIVENANRRVKPRKQEVYVNYHGFLTQTRPDGPNPEIYVPPPSQSQEPNSSLLPSQYGYGQNPSTSSTPLRHDLGFSPSPSLRTGMTRSPLSTLALSPVHSPEDEELGPIAPLRRLTKRSRSTSPSGPKSGLLLNAFDVLGKKNQSKDKGKAKARLGKSEYVQGEAQESDEDEMYGFGLKKKDLEAEEDDGEEMDAILEELVDDAEMDEETRAEHLVLEKVKEHQEEDDKKLEKLAQDAVDGNLRIKRRAGLGFNDSDDEDDDEDMAAKRIRRQMAKKRRIEGDSLDELAKNPETLPFWQTYQNDLADDNREFAHLLGSQDVQMNNANNDDNDENDEEADDENEGPVAVSDIREQLRAVARRNEDETEETLNPHDVSWMDEQDVDDVRVRVNTLSKLAKLPREMDADGFEIPRRPREDPNRTQLSHWATEQTRALRSGGAGRSNTGSAVTGHGKKVKAGGGSLRPSVAATSASASSKPKTVKAAPSLVMTAVSSDRRARFG